MSFKLTKIMEKNIFYHDGCKVCSETGQTIISLLGISNLNIVHIGMYPSMEQVAKSKGVKTFPALVTNRGSVLHLNVLEHEGSIENLLN